MPRESLGEFEQLVLLAILHLAQAGQPDIYGVSIADEIEQRTPRRASRVAVYIALRRLEQKGFVKTWMGAPVSQYGDVLIDDVDDPLELLRAGWQRITATIKPDVVTLPRVRARISSAVRPLRVA